MSAPLSISTSEMLDSLKRSGYLIESEIAKELTNLCFFVEANQVIQDPFTGKSREIDLLAEYNKYDPERAENRVAAKIKFVFEIKNNIYPIVLLTELPHSPNIDLTLSLKIGQTGQYAVSGIEPTEYFSYLFLGNEPDEIKTFTQYCSFQPKKNNAELMAFHPEEIHTGLNKITQYSEECAEFWEDYDPEKPWNVDYNRNFLFLPAFILNNALFQLTISDEGNPLLEEVDYSRILFNYHYKDSLKQALVYFVTRKGLEAFLDKMLEIEEKVEANMLTAKKEQEKGDN
jgi:hypothetical protein